MRSFGRKLHSASFAPYSEVARMKRSGIREPCHDHPVFRYASYRKRCLTPFLNSRIGLVLVTPALLDRLPQESVADKELSALLAGNQLIPIVHNTTYEDLRNVSPLLASRSGLDTAEDSMAVVAIKIAELVTV